MYLTYTARTVTKNTNDETFIILQDSTVLYHLYLYAVSKLQPTPLLDNGVKITSKRRSPIYLTSDVFLNVLILELLFSTGKSYVE